MTDLLPLSILTMPVDSDQLLREVAPMLCPVCRHKLGEHTAAGPCTHVGLGGVVCECGGVLVLERG